MISDEIFRYLVDAASKAPSSDNMQPWLFQKSKCGIEVYCNKSKLLKIDVLNMFTLISIGAAIENILAEIKHLDLIGDVRYADNFSFDAPIAFINISIKSEPSLNMNKNIISRVTNRKAYLKRKIDPLIKKMLTIKCDNTDTHWIEDEKDLYLLSKIDQKFSYILLDHEPLFDSFFETIRFSNSELKRKRCGMDIRSLDIPYLFAFIAKKFKKLKVNRIICRLGLGPSVTKSLANRIKKCGAVSLISIKEQSFRGYLEAGRSMAKIWLKATSKGLSIHPYGVIPQYLTMANQNPEIFKKHHLGTIRESYDELLTLYPNLTNRYPAILLRIGYSNKLSSKNDIRYNLNDIILEG